MILSLIGLPGVGKTKVSSELALQMGCSVLELPGKKTKRLLFLRYCLKQPRNTYLLLWWTVKYNKGGLRVLKHKIFFLLLNSIAKEVLATKQVVDEGLLQYLCAISDKKLLESEVLVILNSLKFKNRKVFIVTCDEAVRMERLEMRGRVPRSAFGVEYSDIFYKNLTHNFNLFYKLLSLKFESEIIKN